MAEIRPCVGDRRCLYRCEAVGLDSSFLFILIRAVSRLGATADQLFSWLVAFSCSQSRQIVTSDVCQGECEPLKTILPELLIVDMWSAVQVLNVGDHSLPYMVITFRGNEVAFDPGERSLVSVLQGIAGLSVFVAEDEDALDIANELMLSGATESMPVYTVKFVREMFLCGVLTEAIVIAICETIQANVVELYDMSEHKRTRKLTSTHELLNLVGAHGDAQ